MKHVKTLLPAVLAGLTVMTVNGPVSAEQMVMVCKQYPASQVQITGKPTSSANTVQFRNPTVEPATGLQSASYPYDHEHHKASYGRYYGNGNWLRQSISAKQAKLLRDGMKAKKVEVRHLAAAIGLALSPETTDVFDLKKGEASLLISALRKKP